MYTDTDSELRLTTAVRRVAPVPLSMPAIYSRIAQGRIECVVERNGRYFVRESDLTNFREALKNGRG
jgi:predicted site-specific integrase-resolvase